MRSNPFSHDFFIRPAALCLAFSAVPAFAAVIGTEPFDYPDGGIAGQAGGTGWDYLRTAEPDAAPQAPSDWNDVTATPQVVDGRLETSASSAKREFGGLTEGADAGSNEREGAFRGEGTVYFAVDYSVDALLPEGANQWGGFSSYDFGTERIFFGVPGQSTAQRFFGITGAAGLSLSTVPVEAGVAYRLIGAVDFANAQVKLWVNPDSADFDEGAESSADVSLPYTGTNWASAVRLGSGDGFTTTWDNLKVADDLMDLLPAPSGVLVSRISLTATDFSVRLTDAAGAVFDPSKPVSVTLDGTAVPVTITKAGDTAELTFRQTPPQFFANGAHQLVITARDTANGVISHEEQITTRAYSALQESWKPAAGAVDTTKPGFRATLNQLGFGRYPDDVSNLLPQPERQLGLGYTEHRTGAWAQNLIEPGPEAGGFFIAENGIDWDINTNHGAFPGVPVPGLPGGTGSNDNVVAEITAWLELPAGVTQLGVNSDDGFLVTSGATPLDALRRERLAVFDGGRGSADTIFDVAAPSAGLYPVRLLWWQGNGEANVEFFSVKADGSKVLVGDSFDTDAIKAYYSGRAAIPTLHTLAPYPDSRENGALQPVRIEILDGVAALNDSSVTLTLDGAAVSPTLTRPVAGTAVITLNPPGGAWAWASSHQLSLTYQDTAGASRTETWSFTVSGDPNAVVGAEPFDYPDGLVAGLSGGTGWNFLRTAEPGAQPQEPSDWNPVTGSPEVVDGALLTSGTSAKREFGGVTEGGDAGSNEREGAFRGIGTVYVGVDYSIDTLLADGTNQWSGFSSYDFGTERIFFGVPGQSTGIRYFGVAGTALTSAVLSDIPAEAGVTYRLVGAVDFDSNLVKLWVNPDGDDYDNGVEHSADAVAPYEGTNWSSAVRLGSGDGFITSWDNLAVAQRLTDVLSLPSGGTLPLVDFSIDRAAGTVALTWRSSAGQTFAVEYSRDLKDWSTLTGNIAAGGGDSTTWQGTLSTIPGTADRLYLRARTAP